MKKLFDAPELTLIRFDAKDILTSSQWDTPIIPVETDPEESGWETPIYPAP